MNIPRDQLQPLLPVLERYVRYRIAQPQDAEDVLQEILTAALTAKGAPSAPEGLKAWLLGIARHKTADYFRTKYRSREDLLPHEAAEFNQPVGHPRFAFTTDSAVQLSMEELSPQDQQVIHLLYWQQLPLQEIAARLRIPVGTVKSRLHHARERFRAAYSVHQKGDPNMAARMPDMLPEYTIAPSPLPPFECCWEELMGWFIVPRLGESLTWAMYDMPDRVRTEGNHLTVTGRYSVHGIEGVSIDVQTLNPITCNAVDDTGYVQRSLVAQLTDTHCRILSETHQENGVTQMTTFLDGDTFVPNWGFGEDNCGNETHIRPKGIITRSGREVHTASLPFLLDVVGRYSVAIFGKVYDTICVMDVESYNDGTLSEQYIDKHGRTILWRRFNADDWRLDHYGKRWSEMLPDSLTLIVNGRTYVHWYDCITSYIL